MNQTQRFQSSLITISSMLNYFYLYLLLYEKIKLFQFKSLIQDILIIQINNYYNLIALIIYILKQYFFGLNSFHFNIFSKIHKFNFILANLHEFLGQQSEIQEKELKTLKKYIDISISKQNSPQRLTKKKKLIELLEESTINSITGEEEKTIQMATIQKQIKKADNSLIPAIQGKDINSLRKQLMCHDYYTNIEPYMSERFQKVKRKRGVLKGQKINTQYGNILLSTNPFSQNQAGLMQSQLFGSVTNTMFIPSLNNIQSNTFEQLQVIHQSSVASLNNPPLFKSIDSSILLQNTGQGLIPQILLQNQSQQMSTIIQSTTNQQSHDLEYKGGVSNYMKLDKVQQSVKKDISIIQDDDDESESDQRVYEQFSYTYSFMQNDRKKDITIEHHDLKKLVPNQYLNDTIVNFFLKQTKILYKI